MAAAVANAVELGSVARVTVPAGGELIVVLCVALLAGSTRGEWEWGRLWEVEAQESQGSQLA